MVKSTVFAALIAAALITIPSTSSAQIGESSMNDNWTTPAPTMSPNDIKVDTTKKVVKPISKEAQIKKNMRDLGLSQNELTPTATAQIITTAQKAAAETYYYTQKAKFASENAADSAAMAKDFANLEF
jgi:hypothetical protein